MNVKFLDMNDDCSIVTDLDVDATFAMGLAQPGTTLSLSMVDEDNESVSILFVAINLKLVDAENAEVRGYVAQ